MFNHFYTLTEDNETFEILEIPFIGREFKPLTQDEMESIRKIKKIYHKYNESFLDLAEEERYYDLIEEDNHTKYFYLDIEAFIIILKYFDITYDIEDIKKLYPNEKHTLYGDEDDNMINLCVSTNKKCNINNSILYIEICNELVNILKDNLPSYISKIGDSFIIPLFKSSFSMCKKHLKAVGINPNLYMTKNKCFKWEKYHLHM